VTSPDADPTGTALASKNHFKDFLVALLRDFDTCLDWFSPAPGRSSAQAVSIPGKSNGTNQLNSSISDILTCRYIPICCVITVRAAMNSNAQIFFDFFSTLRTLLRSPPRINFGEKLSSLPTHVLDNATELTESSIKHMFAKHAFSPRAIIQVFHEDHIPSITKRMSLFEVKILPCVVDSVVKSCNFNALSLVIG
jgi:hypothetical protein